MPAILLDTYLNMQASHSFSLITISERRYLITSAQTGTNKNLNLSLLISISDRMKNVYCESCRDPKVRLIASKTYIGKHAPTYVASFSSRGPNSLSPAILKVSLLRQIISSKSFNYEINFSSKTKLEYFIWFLHDTARRCGSRS